MAYSLIEPFGSKREDERAGILATVTMQPHLKKGKKVKPEDFFPDRTKFFGQTKKKQSWKEQMKILMPLVEGK